MFSGKFRWTKMLGMPRKVDLCVNVLQTTRQLKKTLARWFILINSCQIRKEREHGGNTKPLFQSPFLHESERLCKSRFRDCLLIGSCQNYVTSTSDKGISLSINRCVQLSIKLEQTKTCQKDVIDSLSGHVALFTC